MEAPKIISYVKSNGEWVNKDDLPEEVMNDIVEQVIVRAAASIGFTATKVVRKEKTA